MPKPGSGSMRCEDEARAVGELDLDERRLHAVLLREGARSCGAARSTNASCGPSATGVQIPLRRASPRRRRRADVRAAELRDRAPARRALDEAELQQVRLVDVLDRVRLLAERRGERREADRPAVELVGDRAQQLARLAVEALLVDLEQLERLARDLGRDRALVAHLGDVAHAAEDAVRDARRAARAPRDLLGGVGRDLDAEDARRAVHDRAELARVVVVEPERQAEAVAERRRQQARARRRADERERRQVERERARGRALAHDDVERKSSSAG